MLFYIPRRVQFLSQVPSIARNHCYCRNENQQKKEFLFRGFTHFSSCLKHPHIVKRRHCHAYCCVKCWNWWFSFHQNEQKRENPHSNTWNPWIDSTLFPIFTFLLFHFPRLFTCDNYTYSWTSRENPKNPQTSASLCLLCVLFLLCYSFAACGLLLFEWIVCKFPFSIFSCCEANFRISLNKFCCLNKFSLYTLHSFL